jgi:Zn-dependent protease with chaperone function
VLGLAVIEGMSEQEFRAVLAHEYGHFVNGDLKIGTLTTHVQSSLFHMLAGMASVGRMAWANPAFWMLRLFLRMYMMVTRGSDRVREILADRGAAALYGGKAFSAGLRHVVRRSALFEGAANTVFSEIAQTGQRAANVYALLAQPSAKLDLPRLETAAEEAMQRAPSRYDSHPPPVLRIAWAERYRGEEPDRYASPAAALLNGRDCLDQQMSEELEGRMRAYLGAVQPAPAAQ